MNKKNRINNFVKLIFQKIYFFYLKFQKISIFKYILFIYLFINLLGSLILFLPISHKVSISYLDAIFTSASAFSDTGLTLKTTSSTWTYFGQAIITILIIVGGIGFFSLKFYIFNVIFGKPLFYNFKEIISIERGNIKNGSIRKIIKVSIIFMFVLIIIFSLILSIYFYFTPVESSSTLESPTHDWGTSIRYGIFHSISALNNAGFDIMGSKSINDYYHNYTLQVLFIILFVIGGIGYPVIYDFYLWIKSKILKNQPHFSWSLFSKLSISSYLICLFLSLGFVFLIETNVKNYGNHISFWHNKKYGSYGDKTMAIIFNSLSTRNAGFSTIDMNDLSNSTLFVFSILMFLGAAPSSTAGGIRTTTIAIIFLSIWSRIRNKHNVHVFNRRISSTNIIRSFIVFVTALIIIILCTLIFPIGLSKKLNHEISDIKVLFEVTSAFGTTGLSTGLVSNLFLYSKIILIFVMFFGQLGISSTLIFWKKKKKNIKHYDYIKEDVPIS